MTLGVVLLQDSRGDLFLMSEDPCSPMKGLAWFDHFDPWTVYCRGGLVRNGTVRGRDWYKFLVAPVLTLDVTV